MEESTEKKGNKISNFFKNKENLVLVLIIVFALIIRIWVYIKTLNQPIWWDEGDYLAAAKRWGLGLNIHDIWYYRRAFLLPVIWAGLYKLSGSEAVLRFTEVIFSWLVVYFTYLLGKEMFNKHVGLIAAFGVAASRINIFLTGRLLTELPATCFFTLGLYFLWKGYVNDKKYKFLVLGAVFIGLGIMTRFALLMSLIPLTILFITTEGKKVFKSKYVWSFFIIFLIISTPFLILYKTHYPGGLSDFYKHYTGAREKVETGKSPFMGWSGVWQYFMNYLSNTGTLFVAFLIGLVYILIDLVFGFDLVFKDKEVRNKLFMLILVLTPVFVHGLFSEYVEERYLIYAYPTMLIIAGFGLVRAYEYLTGKNIGYVVFGGFVGLLSYHLAKNFTFVSLLDLNLLLKSLIVFLPVLIVCVLIGLVYYYLIKRSDIKKASIVGLFIAFLFLGAYLQVGFGKDITLYKKYGQLPLKEAGEFIKLNSESGDVVYCESQPQMQYYGERSVYRYGEYIEEKDIREFLTEEEFLNRIKEQKPKYMVVSIFDGHPDWIYEFIQKRTDLIEPVKVWFSDPEKTKMMLIVFKFKN